MQTKFITREYITEFINLIAVGFFGGMFFAIGVSYLYENLSLSSLQLIWLIGGVILSVIYGVYRKKFYLKNRVWHLNNNILTKGEPINTTFDLNKIEFMTFGLPKSQWVSFFTKFSFIPAQEILKNSYSSVLTIKFRDNTYLILNVLQQKHLLEIINQILVEHQDKIVEDYIFTDEEVKILKVRESNRLLTLG